MTPTWCPQCGPGVAIDEDGCCVTCGATSTGPGADAVFAQRIKNAALKASIVELDHKYARALSDLVAQRREGESDD